LTGIVAVVEGYADQRRNSASLSSSTSGPAETARSISISELEQYAECPFRYHAARGLKLAEPPSDDMDVTASERGIILHRIAFEFYRALAEEARMSGDEHPGVRLNGTADDYRKLLMEIGVRVLDDSEFGHPYFEVLKNALLGNDGSVKGVLDTWLDAEIERYTTTWFAPLLLEAEFGVKSDGSGTELLLAGRSFRGRIDRVDVRVQPDGTVEYLVVDYKSSDRSFHSNTDIIQHGSSFQMPVYIEAARQLLREKLGERAFVARGGLYVAFEMKDVSKDRSWSYVLLENVDPKVDENLKGTNRGQVLSATTAPKTTDEAVATSMDKAARLIENMNLGLFPVQPAKAETCTYCPYGSVCGIEDLRRMGQGLEGRGDADADAGDE
ncbi:MAG: PD-(D/E)XK nuclease family protein, partial [Candidatus Kapaibacterium sp.]